jgi:hypothetical protein
MKVSKKRFNFQHGKFTAAQPDIRLTNCPECGGELDSVALSQKGRMDYCYECREKDREKTRAEGYAEAMTKFSSMREAEKEKIRAEGIMQGRKLQEAEDRADCQKCVWNKSVRREAQKQEARKE